MRINKNVIYRYYQFVDDSNVIAYNKSNQCYCFLDGLSADLFHMIADNQEYLGDFLSENEIDEDTFSEYMESLSDFGMFECSETKTAIQSLENDSDSQFEYEKSLVEFSEKLFQNELFYSFHIDITNRCNLRCVHCYHTFEDYIFSEELSLVQIKSIIDTIYELGVFSVVLSGGEVFLRNDIFDILDYISKKHMMITLFTNGIHIDDDVVSELEKYNILKVSISLYSDNEEVHDKITGFSGSFQKSLQAIQKLRTHNIPVEIKCVALKENQKSLFSTKKFAEELGCSFVLDFGLTGKLNGDCSNYNHRITDDDLKKIFFEHPVDCCGINYEQNGDSSPCNAGKYSLYCSANGDIFPCVSFRYKLCSYENLNEVRQNIKLIKWLETKVSDFSDCMKHDYCKFCNEICAGNNEIENGNYLNSNTSHCVRAKIVAEYYMQKGGEQA